MKDKIILLCFVLFFCGTAQAQFEDVKKGDIIEIKGVKAIVFKVDGNGHGSAMTITALRGKKNAWCADKNLFEELPSYSDTDGLANTLAIYRYMEQNNLNLSLLPAFEWCRSLGEGWYIPSVNQLEAFVNYILGNEQEYDWDSEEEFGMDEENVSTKEINERITQEGGVPFIANANSTMPTSMGVYTSTKSSDNKIYVYEFLPKKNTFRFKKVRLSYINIYTMGRAFYDF